MELELKIKGTRSKVGSKMFILWYWVYPLVLEIILAIPVHISQGAECNF